MCKLLKCEFLPSLIKICLCICIVRTDVQRFLLMPIAFLKGLIYCINKYISIIPNPPSIHHLLKSSQPVQWHKPQSIQSARLSFQSSDSAPPTPSPAGEGCSSLVLSNGGYTFACEGGDGGTQLRSRDRHSVLYTL
jgi:hypothetical protein